ncbi:MAG: dTDP-4-dehydrorhamnose reductase [Thermoplasmata archaeon]|nr:dTDP-4-dehydrorhamnose reductase [Thermoplasmata archaeon]
MEKILVVGASGLLGSKIVNVAKDRCEVYGTYCRNVFSSDNCQAIKLDITDLESTKSTIERVRPDWIILTSAQTNVDLCEREPKIAWDLNVEGPKNVAVAAEKVGSRLIYISTDYVFDGEKGYYTEDDIPNPISEYGRMKLEGEKVVKDICVNYIIARVAVLYGWNTTTGKLNFITWVIDRLRKGEEARLFTDQYITPTFALNAAELLIKMIEKGLKGLYHMGGGECINRYKAGLKIANSFDLDKDLLQPTTLDQFEGLAKRPRNSCLNSKKLEKELNIKMMNLDDGLEAMKREYE